VEESTSLRSRREQDGCVHCSLRFYLWVNLRSYGIEVELTYSGKKFHDKFLLVNPSRNIKDVEIRRYDANKK